MLVDGPKGKKVASIKVPKCNDWRVVSADIVGDAPLGVHELVGLFRTAASMSTGWALTLFLGQRAL